MLVYIYTCIYIHVYIELYRGKRTLNSFEAKRKKEGDKNGSTNCGQPSLELGLQVLASDSKAGAQSVGAQSPGAQSVGAQSLGAQRASNRFWSWACRY